MADFTVPGELNIYGVRSTAHFRLKEKFSEDGGKTGASMSGAWEGLIAPDASTAGTVIDVDDASAGSGEVWYELTPTQLDALLDGATRRLCVWQVQLTRNSKTELIRWGEFEIVLGLS